MDPPSPVAEALEARVLIPLPAEVVEYYATRYHRLYHFAWHTIRERWGLLSPDDRLCIVQLLPGWGEPRPSLEYAPDGQEKRPLISNGSGKDFLFMHREMILQFQRLMGSDQQPGRYRWVTPPAPGADVATGFAVPETWVDPADAVFTRRMAVLKSDEFYWNTMRWWDREFKDPTRLRQLTLAELGSLIEYSIHNDMHQRWSSAPRDAAGNVAIRPLWDISPGAWDGKKNDFLGDFYSSHVHPLFWRLHGWIDDRIEDWFAAHEDAHPGEVVRTPVRDGHGDGDGDVPWFFPGKWVKVHKPWSAPGHCHGGRQEDEQPRSKHWRKSSASSRSNPPARKD